MTRVLIAVDETEESHRAVEAAHRLFGDTAEYLAINVAEDPHHRPWGGAPLAWGTVITYPYPYASEPYAVTPGSILPPRDQASSVGDHDATQDAMHRAEDVAGTVASEAGLPDAEVVGAVGDPVETILTAVRSHHVDVVVVGSHERGWFSRLLDGSVAEDLVRSSSVPVLVVNQAPDVR